ncbi:dTDP-4-dehydrorhamnose reductase [Puteibacter caeruleilacunae]|nr:dTDP-4-dehydrorhamnose reductase [Puteibacter caeruleilacunae]
MKNILVTGANGQLGNELRELARVITNWSFFFSDLPELDICDQSQINVFVQENKINVIINCAAYTAVDKAEDDEEMAFMINCTGPEILAKVSKDNDCLLVHVSTDFVFDGTNCKPYVSTDACNPINVYGKTKLEGELAIAAVDPKHVIIRTSWLYSRFGNNFVKTIQRLCKERDELGIIVDQIGTPTYAKDLAEVIIAVFKDSAAGLEKKGIYHYSNEGLASWYDFAVAIKELSELECKVNPISTSAYPTPAMRPSYSVMDKSEIRVDFNTEIKHWREALAECIQLLKN